jgi:hypothetical protein
VLRVYIFYIILSIQWTGLLQGLCSVRESAPEQHHQESLQHVLHATALPWSALRQSSSPWNSSVPSLAAAPAYVAVSSAFNAPASVAMPAVVQVTIHRHYRLHLVQNRSIVTTFYC